MKPRVLLVTPVPPFPPDNAGMLRVYSLAQRLRDRYDFSLLTFVRRTGERRFQQHAASLALGRVFSEVHTVPLETAAREDSSGLPEAVRAWRSPEMARRLEEIVRSGGVDLVHIEFLLMAGYVRHVRGVPAVLTEHDLSHLSLFRSYFREWTGLRRFAQIGEWLKMRRFHRDICRRFDRIVALTPSDRRMLERVVPAERLALIPTCVNLDRFPYRPGGERPTDLAYVGHYPHYPNEDAALWFCRRVLPRIRAARPKATLSLIGSSPTPRVRALASDAIEVTGTVPEIAPRLERAKVFVAPIRLGYGVKGKVLEAFASGIPVVATSVVAEGIPECRAGEHMLVADRPVEFADQALRLLGDAGLRKRLAARGRTLVERHYDWRGSIEKLDFLYRGLLRRPARVPEGVA